MSLNGKSYLFPTVSTPPVFKKTFFSEEVYEQLMRGAIIANADVVPYHAASRRLLLIDRTLKPADGLWFFGGRVRPGQTGEQAATAHFKADSGLEIDPARLEFLGTVDYIWPYRQQEPQNVPCHCWAKTYAVPLSDVEIEVFFRQPLREPEYRPGSLQYAGLKEIEAANHHPILLDIWHQVFHSRSNLGNVSTT